MNGSRSPGPSTDSRDFGDKPGQANGHENSIVTTNEGQVSAKGSPVRSADGHHHSGPDALTRTPGVKQHVATNGGDDDGASEAETLIDSPVKKKEADRASTAAKVEKPAKSRIGSLPVPGDDDDDTTDSHGSPMRSVEMTDVNHTSFGDGKSRLVEQMKNESDDESSSGSLSSPRSSSSDESSRGSSRSRARSERPDPARKAAHSPNPRKRKHRASSVSLPNQRSSMEPPRRRLRGLHSEDITLRGSHSPPARNHRRAVSTQSAFYDGIEEGGNRKRRSATQLLAREPKSAKSGWEESDGSSETTSHGRADQRRPQRGVGRATSTPGRPPGREHKRHVNKYGFTRLAEACEAGDLDMVKEWREKDPDQLELAEFAANKPLQIAALNGNDEVVKYLIDQRCQIDCANVDKDTPLIDAAENGHLEVVKILLRAGVDPLRQNLKGQQALDVVTDETDDAEGIRKALREAIGSWNSDDAKRRREQEEEARHAGGPNKELHFMARSYENLLKLVTINDRNGVREFLDARVPVDNALVAAAAKTGDEYLVNMLLAEMTEKKAYQKPEKPMSAVLGSSHFDMLKLLTQLAQFNPLYRSRTGKTWVDIAGERNGPNCRQEKELLQRLVDQHNATMARRSSSPVSKRDQGKRIFKRLNDDDYDSDDDEQRTPKLKKGRRLMSRRDMRAAGGKAISDSESDLSTSGMDTAPDAPNEPDEEPVRMAPPKSPAGRRGSVTGRPRTKSQSNSHSADNSPQTRRRSSRGQAEIALPAVTEEKGGGADMSDADVKSEDKKREETKFTLEEAQRVEAKRKQDEEAAAEAKRVEEQARKAEEERKAEETLRKEKEAEAARVAEVHRLAEEQRLQREAEIKESWRTLREASLTALPASVAFTLDPASEFKYSKAKREASEEDASFRKGDRDDVYLLKHFTPLISVRQTASAAANNDHDVEHWVLNVQIAPLVGKAGLDLLVPRDVPGFESNISQGWTTHSELSAMEYTIVDRVLTQMCNNAQVSETSVKEKIRASIPLYCVKLADAQPHLDPIIRDAEITIHTLSTPAENSNHDLTPTTMKSAGGGSFFANFYRATQNHSTPVKKFLNGRVEDTGAQVLGVTQYTVVHEK